MPPFRLVSEPDGTQRAIKDEIEVTVLPDVACVIRHRVGVHKAVGSKGIDRQTRWLLVELEGSIRLFVHGTHVVVTRQDLNPG